MSIPEILEDLHVLSSDFTSISLYDGDSVRSPVVYQDDNNRSSPATTTRLRTIRLANHDLTLNAVSTQKFDDNFKIANSVPLIAGGGGAVLSFLIAGIIGLLLKQRRIAVAEMTLATSNLLVAQGETAEAKAMMEGLQQALSTTPYLLSATPKEPLLKRTMPFLP